MPEQIVPPVTGAQVRFDAVLAGGLVVAACLSVALSVMSGLFVGTPDKLPLAMLFAFTTNAPIALRRQAPIVCAVLVLASYIVAASVGAPELTVSQVAMFLSFFSIGSRLNDRRLANIARAVLVAVIAGWLLVATFQTATDPASLGLNADPGVPVPLGAQLTPALAYMLTQWLVNIAYFSGAWILGDRSFASARNRVILQRRTRELEEERELANAQAVSLDRIRIARELHDVVAHHVSAMGVQAGAARMVLTRDPDRATAALTQIESSTREAIGELRHILDTLRSPGNQEDANDAPSTASLERLPELVEVMNLSGTPTTFEVVGEPHPVAPLVDVNLYRIAQESLTNARRHGGPQVTADVRVRYGDDMVELEVTNTGRVATAARPGLGTLGMRERATAIGASLDSRPLPAGGFLVRVQVTPSRFASTTILDSATSAETAYRAETATKGDTIDE